MFDDEERPGTRRLGVCRECDELTLSVSEDSDKFGQLVCRRTFKDGEAKPPLTDIPEDVDEDKVGRYEMRRVPRQCKRLEVYETVQKLGVL